MGKRREEPKESGGEEKEDKRGDKAEEKEGKRKKRGNGDAEERNRTEVILALAEMGRSLDSLPKDLAAAIGAGRIPGVIVSRYFAAGEVWGVLVVASTRRIQGAFACG